MSNYPPPQYGGNYGSHDQSNLPYLPPAYPPQYYPQQNQQGGHGQVNASSHGNYNAYGYNHVMPGFSPIPTPGVSSMPLFQGWNHDRRVSTPTFSTAAQQAPYTGYAPVQEQQNQYYQLNHQSNWQQANYNVAAPFGQQHVDQGEYQENVVMDNAPAPQYSNRRSSSAGKGIYRRASSTQPAAVQKSPVERTPSSDFYGQSEVTAPPLSRRDSDPYSPRLSPVATNQSSVVNNQVTSTVHSNRENNHRASISLRDDQAPTSRDEPASGQANMQTPLGSATGNVISRSVEEAKKKAQGALLALRAHEIGQDVLLGEGFRKDILDKLYAEMGWPFSQPSTANATAAGSLVYQPNGALEASVGILKPSNLTKSLPVSTVKSASMGKSPSATAPTGSKVMSEKDRIIQAKMEAFRKAKLAKEAGVKEPAAEKNSKEAATTQASAPAPTPTSEEAQEPTSPIAATSQQDEALFASPSTVVEQVQEHDLKSQPSTSTVVIPGLFMKSTSAKTAAPLTQKMHVPNLPDAKNKRPFIADTLGSTKSDKPAKRPFGFSRSQTTLVIDVSEDDDDSQDEDIAMDIDSDVNQDSPVQATVPVPERFSSGTPVKQSKANATAKRILSHDTRATSTASSGKTSKFLNGSMDLQTHERTIEELKRLIAEKEARRRFKETPSGTQTPIIGLSSRISTAASAAQASGSPSSAAVSIDHSQARLDIDSSKNSSERAESMDLDSPLSDTELSNYIENASHEVILKAQEVEQKQQAARELQAALQKLQTDAELAQRALQNAKDKESRLQAKKKRRSQHQLLIPPELDVKPEETIPITGTGSNVGNPADLEVSTGQEDNQRQAEKQEVQAPEQLQAEEVTDRSLKDVTAVSGVVDGHNVVVTPPVEQSVPHTSISTTDVLPETESEILPAAHEQLSSPTISASATPIAAPQNDTVGMNAAPKSVLLVDATESHPSGADNAPEHELALPSPQAPELPSNSPPADLTKSTDADLETTLQDAIRAQEDMPASELEEGEVDMDMEVSSPVSVVRPNPSARPPVSARTGVIPEDDSEMEDAEEEEDDYEPPDATPPVESPPFSPAPPGEDPMILESGTMIDDMPLISESSSNDLVAFQTPAVPLGGLAKSSSKESIPAVKHVPSFTPYQSPLKIFHAYRFHPQFRNEVAGGLRSLTYSNKIDAKNELCRYESLGGICNDDSCKESHFKDMNIPDVTILGELGSLAQFVGGPRYDEFCKGLRSLIADLPKDKRKDFDVVAQALLEYRAKFLADDSKVLPLEGVTV